MPGERCEGERAECVACSLHTDDNYYFSLLIEGGATIRPTKIVDFKLIVLNV